MRVLELLTDIDGLGWSLLSLGAGLVFAVCGLVLIVRGDDWSGRGFGLVLLLFGGSAATYYYRVCRRLLREDSAPKEVDDA